MKCPKCHYLSFEPEPRCRNCGYDLELPDLEDPAAGTDLVIKDRNPEGPLADLDLRRPQADDKPGSIGAMRAAREAEPVRLSESYRPPARIDRSEPKPQRNLSAVAVVDSTAPRPPRPVERAESARPATRPEPVRGHRPEYTRPESPRVDAPRVDAPRVDAPRVDAPRVDAPRVDVPRVGATRPAAPRIEAREAAKRAPNTTTDLPLFLKRLPDAESPAFDAAIDTQALSASPAVDVEISRPVDPVIAPLEPVRDPLVEPVIEKLIEKPIERPPVSSRKADHLIDELDRPLVKVPAEPRAPLAVRRAAEQPAKTSDADGALAGNSTDRDLLDDLDLHEPAAAPMGPRISRRPDLRAASQRESHTASAAGPVGRAVAATLDAIFLAGVGAAVLWVTLRVIGLTMADLPTLPVLTALPLAAFLLLINLGYLLLFTAAGGQTLGKMAARIRVVGTSTETGEDERLNIARAAYRSLVSLPSVLLLGAGFFPALVGERRAFHDRLAATRVVRV